MRRASAIAAVAALVLAGVLIGALATHLYYARRLLHPGGPPAVAAEMFGRRLESHLELTAEQAAAVREILRRSHDEAASLRRETLPRVRRIMEDATREIETILTEEQRRRFHDLRRRQRRRADQFLLGPPGPHDPHHRGPRHRPGAPPPPPGDR